MRANLPHESVYSLLFSTRPLIRSCLLRSRNLELAVPLFLSISVFHCCYVCVRLSALIAYKQYLLIICHTLCTRSLQYSLARITEGHFFTTHLQHLYTEYIWLTVNGASAKSKPLTFFNSPAYVVQTNWNNGACIDKIFTTLKSVATKTITPKRSSTTQATSLCSRLINE